MHGDHFLHAYSTTQKPIATSSGESEFYGGVKIASRLLGLGALLKDFGVQLGLRLLQDSSASIGVASRRGAGGIKHIETQTLWLQQVVRRKLLNQKKVDGKKNNADLGTKHVDHQTMMDHLDRMNVKLFGERSTDGLRAKS